MAAAQRVFRVSGMHCAGCVSKVEEAIGALYGVAQVAVSLEPGLARVRFDPARVKPMAITQAISDLGYAAEEHLEGLAALDRERALRQAEIRRQSRWMIVAWPLSLLWSLSGSAARSPSSSWRRRWCSGREGSSLFRAHGVSSGV